MWSRSIHGLRQRIILLLEEAEGLAEFVEEDVEGGAGVEVGEGGADVEESGAGGQNATTLLVETLGPAATQATLLQRRQVEQRDEMAQNATDVAPLAAVEL